MSETTTECPSCKGNKQILGPTMQWNACKKCGGIGAVPSYSAEQRMAWIQQKLNTAMRETHRPRGGYPYGKHE